MVDTGGMKMHGGVPTHQIRGGGGGRIWGDRRIGSLEVDWRTLREGKFNISHPQIFQFFEIICIL
jgi:hypothetical protein